MRWDSTSGQYDMGFRNYAPGLNQFLSRDMYDGALADMGLATDPFTGNRYTFAAGNPITNIELDGHTRCDAGDCPTQQQIAQVTARAQQADPLVVAQGVEAEARLLGGLAGPEDAAHDCEHGTWSVLQVKRPGRGERARLSGVGSLDVIRCRVAGRFRPSLGGWQPRGGVVLPVSRPMASGLRLMLARSCASHVASMAGASARAAADAEAHLCSGSGTVTTV
jgi:RHS repeat-associated protein